MKLHLWLFGGNEHNYNQVTMNTTVFLSEVSHTATFKRQSEHVEQLFICALPLRRISKNVQCLLNAYNKVPSINFSSLSMLASI